jgi:hypothetical protein
MLTPKDVLLVDIDFEFEKFRKYFLGFYLEHINLILSKFNLRALSVEFYESTNGNTHIKIKLDREVDYKLYLHLLLALGSDVGLVSISLRRLRAFGDPLVKQFYYKEDRE